LHFYDSKNFPQFFSNPFGDTAPFGSGAQFSHNPFEAAGYSVMRLVSICIDSVLVCKFQFQKHDSVEKLGPTKIKSHWTHKFKSKIPNSKPTKKPQKKKTGKTDKIHNKLYLIQTKT